ncbi:MAG: RNA polymerase factor sigma-54 [Acidobacteriota bacterium]
MALEQKLSLKLAQKLVMTPSLQQAIKLLQMTRIELDTVLSQELIENPVLEEREVVEAEPSVDQTAEEPAKEDNADSMSDIDLEAYFSDYAESWEGQGAASVYEDRAEPPLENTLSRDPDLYDHLLWQLHMMDVEPKTREIAELIIGNLDPEGFLVASVEEIAAMGADGYLEPSREAMLLQVATPLDDDALLEDVAEADALINGADVRALDDAALRATAAAPTAAADDANETSADEIAGAADASADAAIADASGDAAEAASEASPTDDVDAADDVDAVEDAPFIVPPGGYPIELVERALALVRSLDPPGVACRNLQESLLAQLDRRVESDGEDAFDPLTRQVIAEHWDRLTHRKFDQIAKALGVPLRRLEPVAEEIKNLQTRPGRGFSTDRTHYVEPDVHVVKVGEDFVVQLNDDGMPKLRVSRAYRRMLQKMRQEGDQRDAQQYIQEKMRSALWLIKSLDQRQRTIYKVATSICKQQRGFLEYGIEHLRPMVLRDVAEDIEMHESTVSRVVSNKYMHTPRGLFPMKFFFHSGIDREYGGDISSLTVKRKIQQLIQQEDQKKPLSDSALMKILKREGIHIARRTVAKYRDELGIPSSTERKKIF